MDEQGGSTRSGQKNGNGNNIIEEFLDTSKAERAMWLMKCPPLVSRSLQFPPDASDPARPVAKVVLSIDPLRSNDDSSPQVFHKNAYKCLYACICMPLWIYRVLWFISVHAFLFWIWIFVFPCIMWILGFCACLWPCIWFLNREFACPFFCWVWHSQGSWKTIFYICMEHFPFNLSFSVS